MAILIVDEPTTEREIEDVCREVVCPVCHVRVGSACNYGRLRWQPFSHTGRYLLAQRQGRPLPPLRRNGIG